MKYDTKARFVFVILVMLVIALGLLTRVVKQRFFFIGDAAGDALWATMVFLIISLIWPTAPLSARVAGAICFAFAIEFSQVYHAPWIDRIRRTTLGAMVLGSTFVASDLICYVVGVGLGIMAEKWTLWGKWR